MTVYFISGLGADKRVFQKLVFPPEWTIRHIDWLPVQRKESLYSYCSKMAKEINTTEEFAVVGLSFGGIVATELTKILQPKITIIISSISTRQEMPLPFTIFGKLRLHIMVPASLLTVVTPFTYWFFGIKTNEEKQLLKQIIADTSPVFLKWAIHQILTWTNTVKPKKLVHIHGTNDHVFPIGATKADIKIENGGHLMVYNKAEIISKILADTIQ